MKITVNNIKNKKITILGAGLSGTGASELAIFLGAEVFISDKTKKQYSSIPTIPSECGIHSIKCLDCDFAIISPGIPKTLPILAKMKEQNIPIISEIEFASWFTKSKIIGITGSNGKSTTVSILKNIFSKKFRNTYLGGNIGVAFSSNVLKEIKNKSKGSIHILELSSFQLENISTFTPNVACILNLSEDHLDRYKSIDEYYSAKLNIIRNLTTRSLFVYNEVDEQRFTKYLDKTKNIKFGINSKISKYLYNRKNHSIVDSITKKIVVNINEINLQGNHNIENILAAINIADHFKIDINTIKLVIKNFKPLKHRMERINSDKNIDFINDSKATNTQSTNKAIYSSNKSTILILGGYSKGKTNYLELFNTSCENIKGIVCYGKEGRNIYSQLKKIFKAQYIEEFEKAVLYAISLAKNGYRVLLSPACASFDQFRDFEQRGNKFKEIINEYNMI